MRTEGLRAADALERIIAIDSSDVEAWALLTYVEPGLRVAIRPRGRARLAPRRSERSVSIPLMPRSSSQLTWLTLAADDSAGLDGLLERLR